MLQFSGCGFKDVTLRVITSTKQLQAALACIPGYWFPEG